MALNYDLVIIGAGPGGYTAALKAAALGMLMMASKVFDGVPD